MLERLHEYLYHCFCILLVIVTTSNLVFLHCGIVKPLLSTHMWILLSPLHLEDNCRNTQLNFEMSEFLNTSACTGAVVVKWVLTVAGFFPMLIKGAPTPLIKPLGPLSLSSYYCCCSNINAQNFQHFIHFAQQTLVQILYIVTFQFVVWLDYVYLPFSGNKCNTIKNNNIISTPK